MFCDSRPHLGRAVGQDLRAKGSRPPWRAVTATCGYGGVKSLVNLGPPQVWVLPPDVTAAFEARRHVALACAGVPEEMVYTARLLVTELVSNAVLHGSGTVLLTLSVGRGALRAEVHDESPDPPVIRNPSQLSERGAGLRLVAALASSWGTDPRDDGQPGKRVWFTLH